MGYSFAQLRTANSLPVSGSAQFLGATSKPLNTSLFIETVLVTTVTFWAIKVLVAGSTFEAAAFVSPGLLVAAALIPTAIRRDQFAKIGFDIGQVWSSLLMVSWVCVVVFPVLFGGLCLLKFFGLELPMRSVMPPKQGWLCWLFYQFMYVAVAEEVFFRGYLQNNILRLATTAIGGQYRLQNWISISISAACFAVAHIAVQGKIVFGLTFLPGVVLGWLFIRTKTLLAPILFHGLANTCYCLMTAALT